jgi:hypothetical protein
MQWWVCVASLALSLLGSHAAAQSLQASPPDDLQCAYQRQNHPEYILWICNPEGTAPSVEGSVLWVRRNEAGAEILTSVWHGPSSDLAARAEAIISTHRDSNARCERYVYLAQATESGLHWNTATRSMADYVTGAGPSGSSVCYAPEPGAADFVIVWGARVDVLPNAFSVQIPVQAGEEGDLPPEPRNPHPLVVPDADPISIALSVYRVHPGLDNTILRLGPSVFATRGGEGLVAERSARSPLQEALDFVAARAGPHAGR